MTRSAKKRVAPVAPRAAKDEAGGPPPSVGRPEDLELGADALRAALAWVGRSEKDHPKALGVYRSVYEPIEPEPQDLNPWSWQRRTP
jgi:hypothetical protein